AALVAAVILIAGRLHQPLPACTLFHISGNDFALRGGPMRKIGTCIILGSLFLAAAWPQASSSSVGGTVRDQGQAVVPRASVTLTNTATNVARTTLTNESGLYAFPGVFPGPCRVSVESPGMQKYEANVTIQVQQDATIDVSLQVSQTTTQVEVQAVALLVTTTNPTLEIGRASCRERV